MTQQDKKIKEDDRKNGGIKNDLRPIKENSKWI